MSGAVFVLILDLLGTFAFALNGAFTAVRQVRLDIVGVMVLGITTAVGGGIIRDVLIGAIPPIAFQEWYYLAVASTGALIAFFLTGPNRHLRRSVLVLDAIGLSLFCVVGAQKALAFGLDPVPAILMGTVTAVGGGTLRDIMTGQVPTILTSGLYAIPALIGATIATIAGWWPLLGGVAIPLSVIAAGVCFGIRMIGIWLRLSAPVARAHREKD